MALRDWAEFGGVRGEEVSRIAGLGRLLERAP
jgi:hypothetical protein